MTDIVWTDVAPRDGVQTFPHPVSTEQKIRMIRGLLAAGAPRVEATSFVSPKWVPQMADAADVIGALTAEERSHLRVLVPNMQGAEAAIAAKVPNVLVTIGATETFNHRNVNRPIAASLDGCREIANLVHTAGGTCDVAVSVAFGCPFEGAVQQSAVLSLVQKLHEVGVDEIGIADTIGVATPSAVSSLMEAVLAELGDDLASLHVHDTRGLGVANVLAGYEVGVRKFDGSLGGIGGCPFAPRSTGNVCSEDALLGLASVGATFTSNLDAYCALSAEMSSLLGIEFPGKVYRAGLWKNRPMVEEGTGGE